MHKDPRFIYLQSWCDDCGVNKGWYIGDGRNWCDHDPWGSCDECGNKAVKYEIVKEGESDD